MYAAGHYPRVVSATVQTPVVPLATFDLVCLTASLGGVTGYVELLTRLPAEFPAPVVLVLHRPAAQPDRFAAMLRARSPLPVVPASSGERLRPGVVYVVPGGHTAAFDPGHRIRLTPMGGHRLGDPLFASAAALFGPRLIAVVLSGRLDDGAAGVRRVKGAGGRVLAQDEASCRAYAMPAAAIATGCVDYILPTAALADAITALVMVPGAAAMLRVALPPWARTVAPDG
jgi:two-component system, chemotaxis family, protein-glutamate methylesterase/glutaminase